MLPNIDDLTTDDLTTDDINRISEANRAEWEAFLEEWRAQLESLMMLLVTGVITLDVWRDRMLALIQSAYARAVEIANQGVRTLTSEDEVRVQEEVRLQEGYLDDWVSDMRRRGAVADAVELTFAGLTLAYLTARGRLYGNGAQVVMELTFHQSIRLPALPAYPRDGKTVCRQNCKCRPWRIVKLRGVGNWNCYWRLGNAEHCKTCLVRRRVWSPLRIRGGEFITRVVGGDLFAR